MLSKLAKALYFKRMVPLSLKTFLLRYLPQDRYLRHIWEQEAPYPGIEDVSTYPPKTDVRLGIIKSHSYWHQYYAVACRDMGVPYCTIDIERTDWIEQIQSSGCDAFLAWPTACLSIWKQMFDERLSILVGPMGKLVHPEPMALWIWASKRRTSSWLNATGFPHPKTWIFYERQEALKFAETTELPIVTKTNIGSCSSGVRIIRNRRHARRMVHAAFGRGILRQGNDQRDRQWGNILFQQYIPQASEWRIIRIGDSYFGYEKLRVGDFHSGTEQWRYVRPPDNLLNLARDLTTYGGFTCMSIDILVDTAGNYYVNELQALFGMLKDYACMVDNKPGRMLWDAGTNSWIFEEGDFCRNRLCNLRVQVVLDILAGKKT